MKQNRILYWVAGIAAVVGGAYIAIRSFNRSQDKKKTAGAPPQSGEPAAALPAAADDNTDILNRMTQGIANAVKTITSKYMKYRVSTKETALNVRQKPDGSSKIVSKLPKDSIIYARSTRNIGWMEVSRDGKKPFGYVALSFLQQEA